jgi:[acyl-carrier-protein] S-malonyltransferase
MKAYVFPGQGAQFIGMGKELYESRPAARELFERANAILGFRITDIMFAGTEEELKMTKVTQPAVFLHSVIEFLTADGLPTPDMVAGHSLGEFSALVANRTLDFEDALKLVSQRALAMQKACELRPSTMAAILKFDDQKIEEVCASITEEVVVTANYNSPGQLVISGSVEGVDLAIQKLREIGARRVLPLNVGGAFHSPLMQSAQEELAAAIEQTNFHEPICPIYQNISAQGTTDVATIQQNLKDQLTHPVRWTQSVQQMVADGATEFVEFGPGEVLCGLVRRIAPEVSDGVRHI